MATGSDRERLVVEIAELRKAIKRKHSALKQGTLDAEAIAQKQFKPYTDPLSKLIDAQKTLADAIDSKKSVEPSKAKESRPEPETHWEDLFNAPFRYKAKRSAEDDRSPKRSNTEFDSPMATEGSLPVEFTDIDETAGSSQQMRDADRVLLTPSRTKKHTTEFESPSTMAELIETPHGKMKAAAWVKANFKGKLAYEYMHSAITDTDRNTDTTFGVHFDGDQIKMGDSAVRFDDNDDIIVNDRTFAGTRGLYELLFKKRPDPYVYSKEDLFDYKEILLSTNAHRRNNSAFGRIKASAGHKYKEVISVLFSTADVDKKGKGLETMMELNAGSRPEYVYYDDPNELCDRLRLLLSSRDAGHTGHTNEINSIVEELRELGIIKGQARL